MPNECSFRTGHERFNQSRFLKFCLSFSIQQERFRNWSLLTSLPTGDGALFGYERQKGPGSGRALSHLRGQTGREV